MDVPNGTQPCSGFGVNPVLPLGKELYDDGDLVFLANIGPMVEPIRTKEDYLRRRARRNVPTRQISVFTPPSTRISGTLPRTPWPWGTPWSAVCSYEPGNPCQTLRSGPHFHHKRAL